LTAAQLAVGKDLEAEILLTLERMQDASIFDLTELFRAQRRVVASVSDFLRAKKAADLVGPVTGSHMNCPLYSNRSLVLSPSAQAVGENPADSDGNDVANSINTSELLGK
jgi:hypothetical protein